MDNDSSVKPSQAVTEQPENQKQILVKLSGIHKNFIGVAALQDVDFELRAGEVHALIGENGAGKSTLVKVMAGVHQPDKGSIEVNGCKVVINNPHEAQELGLTFIFQELSVVNGLSVAENITLGREPSRGQFFDFKSARQDSHEVLSKIGFEYLDPTAMVGTLSVAEKQGVMIARALYLKANIIVMDEPTSPLDTDEVEDLFQLIRTLRDAGKGIIFVSHRMNEIFKIADRVTIFKDGKKVGTHAVSDVNELDLVRMMVGRQVNVRFPPKTRKPGNVALRVSNLENKHIHGVSFELHEGEILAVAGLVGAGRTELLRAIFGVDKLWDGCITCNGENVNITSTKQAINEGIGLVPEDRRSQGIVARQSVMANLSMIWSQYPSLRWQKEKEETLANRLVDQLSIKTPSLQQIIAYLSGGNQQKAVVGKWLAVKSKILLLDEPTRGIDVGAKIEIYNLINELALKGMAVILVSSELPEVIGMADRILVMRGGYLVAELNGNSTEEEIIAKSMLTQESIL